MSKTWLFAALVALCANLSVAQALVDRHQSPIPLFQSEDVIEVEMYMPFNAVKNGEDDMKHAGKLSFVGGRGRETIPVDFSARGNSRRILCADFPPFKINLRKGHKGTHLKGADSDLKFVSQCILAKEDPVANDEVVREYALYKMLEAAHLPTFKVRLAHVVYRDESGTEVTRGLGFFIEDIEDYVDRTQILESPVPSLNELRGTLAISEAMVKNPDWIQNEQGEKGQNVRTIFNEDKKIVGFVPYDFDLTVYTRSSQRAKWWNDVKTVHAALTGDYDGRVALKSILDHEVEVRSAFENSGMLESSKALFRKNFDSFIDVVKQLFAE